MNKKGFTLIELMIVVVIIGILAAIAIPRFTSIKDEANKSSCRANMHQIATAENMYYAVANTYTNASGDLDDYIGGGNVWVCPRTSAAYAFTVTGTDQFTVPCPFGSGTAATDHGTVTDTGASW
ncbi:MAG: prepilin-type N-terminal cleavage/methylation domain-containing protein [Candidatus Coatesbacteria bacterium]|nr:prepilin-type N-terminal cleavage/methylation domain-containing protein [Candidatus Coatesbacteria bacterium]